MKKKKKIRRRHIREKKGQIWKEETFLNVCATATYWLDLVSFSMCAWEDKNVCDIYTSILGKVCKGWELIWQMKFCNVSEHNLALVTCTDEVREGLIDIYCWFFCRSWPFLTHFKNSGDCFTSLFVLQKVHEMSFFGPADFNCLCPSFYSSLMQKAIVHSFLLMSYILIVGRKKPLSHFLRRMKFFVGL